MVASCCSEVLKKQRVITRKSFRVVTQCVTGVPCCNINKEVPGGKNPDLNMSQQYTRTRYEFTIADAGWIALEEK